jgi:hypothetical protein
VKPLRRERLVVGKARGRRDGLSPGKDLRPLPLGERKAKLARLLARASAGIVFNEHTDEDAAVVFRHACKLGLEGIVSKRLGATYRSGAVSGLDQGQEPARRWRASVKAVGRNDYRPVGFPWPGKSLSTPKPFGSRTPAGGLVDPAP